ALEPDPGDSGYEQLLSRESTGFTPPKIDDDHLAELFYTSGTTANPKGVMMTHRNLYLHAMQVLAGLAIKDSNIQLHTIPLFHVNGWGTPHSITCAGGRHVVIKKFDPRQVLDLVQRERVTHFSMVPTMATALINDAAIRDYDLSSLDFVQIGGGGLPARLFRGIGRTLGCRVFVGVGLSGNTATPTVGVFQNPIKEFSY